MNVDRRKFLISSGAVLGSIVGAKLAWKNSADSKIANAKSVTKRLLRFGVLADTGTGSTQQYAVAHTLLKQHQKSPLDLVVLAGDNIYTNGEFRKIESVFTLPYHDLLKSGVKFYACLGNHDVLSDVKTGDKISNQNIIDRTTISIG
ncbi:metallophosphoesterase [Chamaesiphon sp. GL140_3_metabinner_50]|uniref:metallophosphoesterase n=1 Tax=Chamaesiphon sp. GL140_3_metabinner_50 TaxID=2970812 RepID=UPI0025FBC2A5|nr:metallophosphoesterase [Chamaesiphon sp. GL140_3_metabinner_50]